MRVVAEAHSENGLPEEKAGLLVLRRIDQIPNTSRESYHSNANDEPGMENNRISASKTSLSPSRESTFQKSPSHEEVEGQQLHLNDDAQLHVRASIEKLDCIETEV